MFVPTVSFQNIFEAFMSYLKDESVTTHDRVWSRIKRDLDIVHFGFIYGDEATVEQSAKHLLGFSEQCVLDMVGKPILDIINERLRLYVVHTKVSEASQLDPFEECEVWQLWDRVDAQSTFQDKIDMYRNEY